MRISDWSSDVCSSDLELKAEAGMILVLSRDGTPVLQPVFYGERQAEPAEADDGIEVVAGGEGSDKRRTTLSKRLVDELAMPRRDVLALHVAYDPGQIGRAACREGVGRAG